MPDEGRLAELRAEFARLDALLGHDPQGRGRRFNQFIAELLQCWGVDTRVNERSLGEVDVAFSIGDVRYILEAKWERHRTNTGQLAKLQKRVRQRLSGTYGVFLSMAGYTAEALGEVAHGERLEILLLDRAHLEAMLVGRVSPSQLLSVVRDGASFRGQPYTPMGEVEWLVSQGRAEGQTVVPPHSVLPRTSDVANARGQAPLHSWNPVRSDRGNPKNQYVAFASRRGLYALMASLLGLLIIAFGFVFYDAETVAGRVASGVVILFSALLMIGFGNMARQPIRLEVGVNGLQVFGRRETAWIPWEIVDRMEVVRLEGNPSIVAWSPYANRFPEQDILGGGPRYLPGFQAIAVCPLNVLRARRHEVVRALHHYGGNRI